MDDGGVVPAAQRLADGIEGDIHDLAHEVGADLARLNKLFFLALAEEFIFRDIIKGTDGGDDLVRSDGLMLLAHRLVERDARKLQGDGLFVQLACKDDLCQPAFQRAHVRARIAGEKFQNFRGDHRLAFGRLLFENGDLGFGVGGLDVRDQAAFKAGAQPLFQRCDLLGRNVGGEHDLFVVRLQGVEGVEQLFLHRLFLARNCTSSMSRTSTLR